MTEPQTLGARFRDRLVVELKKQLESGRSNAVAGDAAIVNAVEWALDELEQASRIRALGGRR